MNVLRATAYVLTSLASALFIALVIYGYLALGAVGEQLSNLVPGGTTGGDEQFPGARTTGELMACFENPENPDCY